MPIRQTFLALVILATASLVFGQTTETKPPDVVSGAASNHSAAPPPNLNPCSSGAHQVEILTDTMGVDFGPYIKRITQIVRQNWHSLMPPSVYPPTKKEGKVSVEFNIIKDGKVNGIKLRTPSGDVVLDR